MAKSARKSTEQTAYGPMVVAAIEGYEPPGRRLVDDPLAVRLLPAASARIVRACRFPALRGLLRRISEARTPGVWAGILCRKRYFDDAVRDALDAGLTRVLFLGAGLDTRALRLVLPAGGTAVEIDTPDNVALKREKLVDAFGAVPAELRLAGQDFETADLAAELRASGIGGGAPVMVVWEGVTQYLEPEAVRATLGALAELAPGSRLAFTYVRADLISGAAMHGADKLYRRFVAGSGIWKSGLTPEMASALLDETGWDVVEDVGAEDHMTRYRLDPAYPPMKIERIVQAVKR